VFAQAVATMLTSADALRRFLQTLKDYEESIAEFRHSMQRLTSGDANSPELARPLKRIRRAQTAALKARIRTLDTLAHELLLANIESLEDAMRALRATPARILPCQTVKWVSGALLRGKLFEIRDMRACMGKSRRVEFINFNGHIFAYVPAARVRGPYGCVREAITAVGGFEAARIADGPATVEAYGAKAAKIRERVQGDTALKAMVERVDAWVSDRHSDPSQRSRILGDMVSLLLLDAKAERVMRAARRSTIARAGRGVGRGRPAPPKSAARPRPRAAAAGIASVFAYPCRVVFPLRGHPAHCTNMRDALASVHGW